MSPFVVGTLACVGALLSAEKRGAGALVVVLKPLASLGFLGAALAAGALGLAPGRVLFLALVLSFVGDVCLLGRGPRAFLGGLGAFLLAHVAFAVSFAMRPVSALGLLLALGPLLLVLYAVKTWLKPHTETRMRRPVAAYMIAIAVMVALAAGATAAGGPPALLLGAILFLISDLAVARDRFVAPGFNNRLWGLPLYYAAQLILAASSGQT